MPIRTNFAIAPALLVAVLGLALSACSPSQAPEGAAAAKSSSAGLPPGFVAAGEKQANAKGVATGQSCIDCHGAEGNAPIDPSYPILAGQYVDYLAYALESYRNGSRDHVMMSMQAKDLTDQQIADLAAYFGSRNSQLVNLSGSHKK
ncbi:cytochrome C biogenesis protein CcsA [Lysobacter concretionis Ko07 = DSM 16239]|jgi:cytochrome c553|uniref:Cytochrome C biogenesis protein CcsA n=1 Tax=Lysobacter concretionis Ko07 = DSM 16239 TaxID=1122185 RepID=A0A0A0EL14_9GAMM|nr:MULTISPECIES: c-type cytochrome [Lysobacter]KGM51706.1 cytochrome C biogenesis protein CcsA [Lysobacter concretionis Ko07 = DSM 16239]QOD92232.1 c-type cytochrome [Lysobacter sp. CW239]